ncbi:hypothetical protein PPOP_3257, partial [Paenibacillus popilliae ATCC 14706]
PIAVLLSMEEKCCAKPHFHAGDAAEKP